MRRILFVVNNPDFFLSHRLPLGRAARAAGYDVHVATPKGEGVGRIRTEGFHHHVLGLRRGGLNPISELAAVAELVGIYRRWRPDLVHHVTIKPVLYGGIAARVARVPAVVHAICGLGYAFTGTTWKARVTRTVALNLYRLALGHPRARTIFQNPDDLRTFADRRLVDTGAAVLIRGSGVDVEVYRRLPERAGSPVVVLPARMLRHKGVEDFVEAARRLRPRWPRVRFVLSGGSDAGNPSAIPEKRIRRWEEEGVVEWWGHRDDMPRVFEEAHVVCLPSYREGLPKSLLEAAACGRPIVATDVPGCREIVRDGVNGCLVPVRDPEALAEALHRLLTSKELRRRYGRSGRARAVREFRVQRVAAATLDVYRELLDPTCPARQSA